MPAKRLLLILAVLLGGAAMPATSALAATTKSVTAQQRCGLFKGTVTTDWNLFNSADLVTTGYLYPYTTCPGAELSVWLAWDSPFHHNSDVGGTTALVGGTPGVKLGKSYTTFSSPGHISVTVCSNYHGWHCGPTVSL
jgi:hypothetical protein